MVDSIPPATQTEPETAPGRRPLPPEPRREIWFRRRIGLVSSLRELWHYRELVLTLAERDLRVRYKQAVLGLGWALLTPVLLLGAFNLVFTKVTHSNSGGVPYALFAAVGLVPWSFFSSAFSRGGVSLVQNIPLLNKLYCPREVFPLSSIALAAADALAATLVVVVMFVIYGYVPHIETLWAPVLLLILTAFTAGVVLLVSGFVVYLRDLQQLLPMIVQFGLFVTPVGYATTSFIKGETALVIFAYPPHAAGLWAPVLLLILVAFTAGVVMLVSGLVVYLRDLQQLLPMIVQFGLFVTPVGYSTASFISGGAAQAIFAFLNPIAPVIDGLRRTILHGLAPETVPTVCGALGAGVALLVGLAAFKRMEAGIADIA